MIAETSVQRVDRRAKTTAPSSRGSTADRSESLDQQRALAEWAAQVRADSADAPVFYLIRSNTSYDGE